MTIRLADGHLLRGVAAGQSAVVYQGTRVVAQATITSASRG
jgi:tRNA U34 2-thiouridine synthase MnmA/TrmU